MYPFTKVKLIWRTSDFETKFASKKYDKKEFWKQFAGKNKH